jgi:spore germination cell wall hydrolase CwlJ-like protein
MLGYVFYILQFIDSQCCTTDTLRASVESLETFYGQLNTNVASESERAYRMDVECLTRIVYNESTAEPLLGKKLVAQTTVNRVNSGKFQDSICGAMKAKGAFSFYNPKSKHVDKIRKYPVEYKHIAEKALNGEYSHLLSRDVLYFKRCDVSSSFFNKLVMVTRSGNHCFYRQVNQLIADN